VRESCGGVVGLTVRLLFEGVWTWVGGSGAVAASMVVEEQEV